MSLFKQLLSNFSSNKETTENSTFTKKERKEAKRLLWKAKRKSAFK